MQSYHSRVPGHLSRSCCMITKYVNRQIAGERRILAVNALLLSLASLAPTFQCCGFLLSLLMLQRLHQRQYIVTRADPGLASLQSRRFLSPLPLSYCPPLTECNFLDSTQASVSLAIQDVYGLAGYPHLHAVYMAKCDPSWAGYLVWQTRQPTSTGYLTHNVNARLKK